MIIAVPKNTITEKQKASLIKKGHVIIECDDPEKIKVINTETSIDTNDFFMAAIYALTSKYPTSKSEHFINELHSRLTGSENIKKYESVPEKEVLSSEIKPKEPK